MPKPCIVITGGNGALGQAAAHLVQDRGARPVLLDLVFSDAVRARFECHAVDLTDAPAVARIVELIGPVDALFNVAGGFAMGAAVHDPDDAQWESMFARNVATLRAMLKAVVPGMRQRNRGSIVNVGAVSALHGSAGMSAYTASKAVVINLTESLAAELKHTGIRVNAVLPSIIDTPANRQAMPDAGAQDWVPARDIAEVMFFLAGAQSRAIHGALIPVTAAQQPLHRTTED